MMKEENFMREIFVMLAVGVMIIGCSQQKGPQPVPTGKAEAPATALVAYNGIGIRHQPTDDKLVKNNVFTGVDRGEKVAVLADSGDWAKVKLSDDKEGWIKTSLIRLGVERMAVMVDEVQVFVRPDPSSRGVALDSSSGKLGSIVWIFKAKDGYYDCEFPGNRKGWVKVGALSEDQAELDAARLLEQARKYATRKESDLADKYYKQIANGFPATKVSQIIVLESDVQPAASGE
jgi:SH3-like domain-containing protein